jgi:hypothetical protein
MNVAPGSSSKWRSRFCTGTDTDFAAFATLYSAASFGMDFNLSISGTTTVKAPHHHAARLFRSSHFAKDVTRLLRAWATYVFLVLSSRLACSVIMVFTCLNNATATGSLSGASVVSLLAMTYTALSGVDEDNIEARKRCTSSQGLLRANRDYGTLYTYLTRWSAAATNDASLLRARVAIVDAGAVHADGLAGISRLKLHA